MLPSTVNKDIQKALSEIFQGFDYTSIRIENEPTNYRDSSTSMGDSLGITVDESEAHNKEEANVEKKNDTSEDTLSSPTKVINSLKRNKDVEKKESIIAAKTKEIAVKIRDIVLGYNIENYKYLVQVNLFQSKDVGTRIDCRMLWDAEKDQVIEEIFKTVITSFYQN
ncbi:hypothetical protein DSO57_1009851 [Entomophthora muscae]|uniref:Uncharacterized protein n=2 Tax=Entomophthora muscae TaxID=34485 RepID=A0ACC2TTV2_9FUNG|nr:hypothetical protein DSO57_1035032 [Entomophthora muscae]KAJ9078158.1 hypothetical protein DSO57_1009851 [Entomophthora muscae]